MQSEICDDAINVTVTYNTNISYYYYTVMCTNILLFMRVAVPKWSGACIVCVVNCNVRLSVKVPLTTNANV